MDLKTEFDALILQSVSNQYIQPNSFFYNRIYEEKLRKELSSRNLLEKFEERELKEVSPGKVKMCSVASSSRLCFLYFANKTNTEFECSLGTGTRGIAQLDAFDGLNYYECKCHEIFDKHDNYLRAAYKANLEKYLGLNKINIEGNIINLSLKELEINDNSSIYSWHFDVKQFLCHLFGIAKKGGGNLQYIFFTPSHELINKNSWCTDFYNKLDEEINNLWNSPKIQIMLKNCNIELPKPLKIQVSEIEDFILVR